MSFRSFFMHLIQGAIGKSELKVAEEAGERDGEALGQAYTVGMGRGLNNVFTGATPSILGETPNKLPAITDDRPVGPTTTIIDASPIAPEATPPTPPEPAKKPRRRRATKKKAEDYEQYSRAELMRKCKEHEPVIKTARTDTAQKLRVKLQRADKRQLV